MSRYTTTLAETAHALCVSSNVSNDDDYIKYCADMLFDFDFPFWDAYRDEWDSKQYFKEQFVRRYYYVEIGQPTIGEFRHRLQAYLKAAMPIFIAKHKTELLKYNMLEDTYMVEVGNESKQNTRWNDQKAAATRNVKTDESGNIKQAHDNTIDSDNNADTISTESIIDKTIEDKAGTRDSLTDGTSSEREDTAGNTNSKSFALASDFPQGNVEDNRDYATAGNDTKSDESTDGYRDKDGTHSENTKESTTEFNTTDYTRQRTGDTHTTDVGKQRDVGSQATDSISNLKSLQQDESTANTHEHGRDAGTHGTLRRGNSGRLNYTELLQQYRELTYNTIYDIIDSCNILFLGVY